MSNFKKEAPQTSSHASQMMDKLKKSFRVSFRPNQNQKCQEPQDIHQWYSDELAVRQGNCSFPIKYLGGVEVSDSKGISTCEKALKVLRDAKRKSIRGSLSVTRDGIRVIDSETKSLIVDQTIEKISFCSPDRSNSRGFAYICQDGATSRWMCHGFQASGSDTGRRLSHAVACCFAIVLERKQKKEREEAELAALAAIKQAANNKRRSSAEDLPQDIEIFRSTPVKKRATSNPYAIDRPHAALHLLQRQYSCRDFQMKDKSPFKRQLSLKLTNMSPMSCAAAS